MKLKEVRAVILTLIIATTVSVAFNVTTVTGQDAETSWVTVMHTRTSAYYAKYSEDSVSNMELDGLHERGFSIWAARGGIPEGAEVHDAKIVMETPYPEDPYFPSIVWDPWDIDFTVTPLDGTFRYEWAFQNPVLPFGYARVGLEPTNFPVTFRPEFDSQRTVDPIVITSSSAIQTLTVKFKPFICFFYTHIYVCLDATDDVAPSLVPGSASADLGVVTEQSETPQINWIIEEWEIEIGREYTLSAQISVENKRYPEPVLYKPHVAFAGFVSYEQSLIPSTENVTVEDDLLQGSVTYCGVGPTGELLGWEVDDQYVTRVAFPPYSTTAPVSATIDIDPDTLNLKSNGMFITAYIELPDGYNVADIDLSTVTIDGIEAIKDPQYDFVTDPALYLMDHDGDGILERMVKFDRTTVRDALTGMSDCEGGDKFYDLPLTVTGKVAGISFEGTDTIVVIKK